MADEIYVDPSAGGATRILVGDVWYVRAGASDEDFTVEAGDIEEQSCDGCCGSQYQAKYVVVANVMGCDWARFH